LNPQLTEAQIKDWENLAAKLSYGHVRGKSMGASAGDEDEDDEETEVDVLLSPHAILHESNLTKKSHTSMVGHTTKRRLILLNDALLITKPISSGIMKTSESFSVRQSFHLNKFSIRDLADFGDDSKLAFEILTSKRPYVFVADTESEKRIWLEELTLAIYAVYQTSPEPSLPGWQHLAVRGTVYSLAFMGEMDNFLLYIGKHESSSLDTLDSSGMSALHWAALGGHRDIAQIILEHDGDPNILNSGLNSPLHLAASSGHSTTVQVLLDFRADLSLRNMKDRDAMYMAVLYCRREKLLENVLKLFFVKGIDLNQPDSSGSTPLHECARRGLSKAIKFLVDEEANVNILHQVSYLTPLQIATSVPFPDAETVRSLLENGAHVNQTNKSGKPPFASVLEQYILSLNESSYDRERVVETVLATLQELARAGARFIDEDLKSLRASFKDAIISARQAWIELEPPDYFSEYSTAGSLVIEKDVLILIYYSYVF
jgi:ankyrin repeat protein